MSWVTFATDSTGNSLNILQKSAVNYPNVINGAWYGELHFSTRRSSIIQSSTNYCTKQSSSTGQYNPKPLNTLQCLVSCFHQTDVVVKSGGLALFPKLLQHSKHNVMKEAAWTISNIAAGNQEQIQALIDNNILAPLMMVLSQVCCDGS